jgi:phosphoribosylamine-glycine ligase
MAPPLLYSKNGDLSAVAPRIGASMILTNLLARKKGLYQGLVPIVPSLEAALRDRPEFVLFDMVGDAKHKLGELADRLRRRMPVYGAGALQDRLELDRGFGLSVALEHGIRVPTTLIFDPARGRDLGAIDLEHQSRIHRVKGHLKEARRFVTDAGGRWVLKPFSNAATSLSYVASSPEDMASRLEEAEQHREIAPRDSFLIQRFIPGVEVSTEVWVCDGELVMPANGTIETKKFLAGDLGPNTGCQTSVVWGYDTPPIDWSWPEGKIAQALPKLVRRTVATPQMRQWLRRPRGPQDQRYPPYHGPLDMNAIISEEDHQPYFLEWTARFGYNAVYALLELVDGDLHDLFRDAADGRLTQMALRPGYAYALRVTIPPFPHHDLLDEEKDAPALEKLMVKATGVHLHGPIDSPHVWLLDAQKRNDIVQTAGFDAVVCEVTGRGKLPEDARDAAHEIFEALQIPNKQARAADGADRAIRDLAKLQAWGLLPLEVVRPNDRQQERSPHPPEAAIDRTEARVQAV